MNDFFGALKSLSFSCENIGVCEVISGMKCAESSYENFFFLSFLSFFKFLKTSNRLML